MLWFRAFSYILFLSFLLEPLAATVYYVSNSSGNDSAAGLSAAAAWKSLSRVNSQNLRPGDRVLLRRGDLWRQTLNPNSSGALGNPIVIESYGTGTRPKIWGSESLSGEGLWFRETAQRWYITNVNVAPRMIFHNGGGGERKATKNSLASPWDWWYDTANRRVYVYLNENPGAHDIELPQRPGVGWAWANHIVVRGLEIAFAEFGVALYGGQSWSLEDLFIHDIVVDAVHGNGGSGSTAVRDCRFEDWNWQGFRVARGAGASFQGYGIHVMGGSEQWLIDKNQFRLVNMQSGEDSTAIAIDIGGHASSISDNEITGRRDTEAGGIMIWRPKGSSPITIRRNRIMTVGSIGILLQDFAAYSFNQTVLVEGNLLQDTCGRDIYDQEALRIWTANNANVILRGNVVNRTWAGSNEHHGIHIRQSRATVAANTIYGTDIGVVAEQSGTNATVVNNISSGNRIAAAKKNGAAQWSEFSNALDGPVVGFTPAGSTIRTTPGFVNAPQGDFQLRTDSAALDIGAPLGSGIADFLGTPRPQGAGWDIGAYERVPQAVPSQPVSIAVYPTSVNLGPGGAQQFVAEVLNTPNTGVQWGLQPVVGTILSDGRYVAPAVITSPLTVSVIAYSIADPSKTASAVIHLAPQASNLLENGGFETGNLRAWEIVGFPFNVTSGARYSGSFGAKMVEGGRIDQVFPTVPGQLYRLTARVRIDRQIVAPPWGGLSVQIVNATWGPLAQSPYLNTGNSPPGSWTTLSLTFTANSSVSRVVYQNFSPGSFEASADDFSVEQLP